MGKAAKWPKGWSAEARATFLAHLAETSNVSDAAREAGVSSSSVYQYRLRCAEFRKAWADALGEGYARLEARLLKAALQEEFGAIKLETIRARAAAQRLGLALLTVHRPAVLKSASVQPDGPKADDLPKRKDALIARIDTMRERIAATEGKDGAALDNG